MCTGLRIGKTFCCRRSSGSAGWGEVAFRAEAAFVKREIYEALEERGVNYALRVPANDTLEREIAALPLPDG